MLLKELIREDYLRKSVVVFIVIDLAFDSVWHKALIYKRLMLNAPLQPILILRN